MTEPSQYFKGRTVQEQMNEVIGYVDVRSAEVATNAIAADVAQVHQDMLDADADAAAAAASAAAAAGTLANAVKKTGEASQSIAGDIAVAGDLSAGGDLAVTGDATASDIRSTGTLYANNDASVGSNLGVGGTASVVNLIATGNVSVPTPTANNYAANKKYVDDADALKMNIADINQYGVGLTGVQTAAGEKTWVNNQTLNRNLIFVRTGTDVTAIPVTAFNTLVKEVYDGNNVLSASEFVTKNTNGSTWNVRNFFHYFKDANDVLHTIRVGIYYTMENTASSFTLKRVINIFLDGTSVSSETEYTKTVTI